jgi:predicted phage terminase large subunit-like protein
MHQELAAEFERMLRSPRVERFAVAAPRGHAKTTLLLAFVAYCVVYRLKRFIIPITSTAELADIFLGDLKDELEDNARLGEDFPHATGRGPLWRQNVIITRNGIRVQALGAGKKVRGRKHRQHRPDLFVIDDLEDDEHVRNVEQRDKRWAWLQKAVLKARGVAVKADYLFTGTLLHFDAVLARVLDPKRSPGWRSRKYRAVERWADRQDLWQQWEGLYTDWHRPDDERLAAAQAFFAAHRIEMLAGTEVLWPEGESYYDLMEARIDDGPGAFQSEKQNEPLDPTQCKFPEAWFQWFDEVESDGETWLIPEKGDRVRLADCDLYGANDPSKGRRDRGGDPSANVTIAAYPAVHLPTHEGRYRLFWVVDGEVAWRRPPAIMDRILELHALRRYQRFGVEAVQFQELFADDLQERSLTDPTVKTLPIVKLTPISDKILRIEKLGTYLYAGRLRFSRRVVGEYYDHLRYFGQHPHDDGGDATELCLETIGEIGLVFLDLGEGTRAARRAQLSPMDQQLERAFPEIYEDRGTDTCGQCMFREMKRDAPFCGMQKLFIRDTDPACELFEWKVGG